MNATAILQTVESAGGELWAAGDCLNYRLPESALALVADLRAIKAELLELLRERNSTQPPEAEPEDYELGLHRWAVSQCIFRERAWGGIGPLHLAYAVWCDQVGQDVPASRRTFENLLTAGGFEISDGFCYGLILKEDLWAMR